MPAQLAISSYHLCYGTTRRSALPLLYKINNEKIPRELMVEDDGQQAEVTKRG